MATTLTTTYCTLDHVRNRLSSAGVTLRLDDAPPNADEVLDEAAAEIDQYLLRQYTSEELATSRWVKHKAADIAALFLCERRGNPPPSSIEMKAQKAYQILEKILEGQMQVPDIPSRKRTFPVMSNVRTILRPYPRTVVERTRSTGQVSDYVQTSDPYDYLNYYLDYVI